MEIGEETMMTEKILIIDEPTLDVLIYALKNFPSPVVNRNAYLTCYGGGIVPPKREIKSLYRTVQDIDEEENRIQRFLKELEPDFLPLSVTYQFGPSKILMPSCSDFRPKDPAVIIIGDFSRLAIERLQGSGRVHTLLVNMIDYKKNFDYQHLKKLIPSAFDCGEYDRMERGYKLGRGYKIGEFFLPFDEFQSGMEKWDLSAGTVLEYYGEKLMLRNDYGQRELDKTAADWFRQIQTRFT